MLRRGNGTGPRGRLGATALATLVSVLVTGAGLSVSVLTPAATSASADTTPAPSENNASYAIVDSEGGVMTFGGAGFSGDTLDFALDKPIVGAAADPNGGYWLVASDGGIFAYGGAQFYGSTGGIALNKPIVGMAPTPDGGGYWLVASDGGIFSFGDANFWGSTGSLTLNKPMAGMAAMPDGRGYWLVASDGGIFAFGDANFWGSTGSLTLNKPIVGMASTGDGGGYWLVASDGGIFAFGSAPFLGSTGGNTLNAPIAGMSATADGRGYWLVGQDAGVFTFGDAQFAGSAQSPLHLPLFPPGFAAAIAPVVTIMPDVPGPQAAHQGRLRVAFAGDSNGFYEGQYTLATNPPYFIDDGAAPGCGYTNGAMLIPWSNPNSYYTDPRACALWASQLQWVTSRFHPDVTVIQVGFWEAQPRQFEGTYAALDTPSYYAFIQSNLEQAVQIAHSAGGAVILNTSPYFADGTPNNLIDDFNKIVETVAMEFSSYVTVFDAFGLLDPGGAYASVVNGVVTRSPDGVHLTQAGVTSNITPPLNNMINSVAGPVYQGTG